MAKCTKIHRKNLGKKVVTVPCYYIAGNCISDPTNQGGYESFLRAAYPYHHAATYEESKTPRQHIIQPHPIS